MTLNYGLADDAEKAKGAGILPHILRYRNHPAQRPASLSLLNSTETTTQPNPVEVNRLDSHFDHPWDHREERSKRVISQEEPPGFCPEGFFFFSTSYICMETGFIPVSKAARVYYPQIKPELPPVTMTE